MGSGAYLSHHKQTIFFLDYCYPLSSSRMLEFQCGQCLCEKYIHKHTEAIHHICLSLGQNMHAVFHVFVVMNCLCADAEWKTILDSAVGLSLCSITVQFPTAKR